MGLTNNLKDLYERIPKGVKFVFAPIFIRLMVKNKEFQHTWKQLDYFESLSESQKREFQLNSLKKFCNMHMIMFPITEVCLMSMILNHPNLEILVI